MIMPLKNGKTKKWLFNRKYLLNSLRMLSDITKDLDNHLNDDANYMESLGKTDSCNYFKGMADMLEDFYKLSKALKNENQGLKKEIRQMIEYTKDLKLLFFNGK